MKKIIHCITSLEQGGAQAVLADLVEGLPQYEHHIVFMYGGFYENYFCSRSIRLHRVKGFLHPLDSIGFLQLFSIVRTVRPDLIHTSLWAANWMGRIVARILNIPIIMVLHNRAQLNGRLRTMIDRVAPRANAIIAVSHEVKQTFGVAYRAPLFVVQNGIANIHASELLRMQHRKQLGLDPQHIVIGAVGRLHSVKRFDFLVRAFSIVSESVPQARLVIVGSGDQEEMIRAEISRLGLVQRVQIIGGQSARPLYSVFDFFVQSSEQEGISMALLEAMSAGLPSIVTHFEAVHPVIQSGKNGILCTGREDDFAQALLGLMHDPERAKGYGMHAQETVAMQFNRERMVSEYECIFQSYLKS